MAYYPASDEMLIRSSLTRIHRSRPEIGLDHALTLEEHAQAVQALEWQTQNHSGTRTGGACHIRGGTPGADWLIAEIAWQKAKRERQKQPLPEWLRRTTGLPECPEPPFNSENERSFGIGGGRIPKLKKSA